MVVADRKRGRPPQPGLAESRREQILAAATRLFARDGFPATDLQQVADALGVGKGTVYRYFPSKGDLFLAAVDRAIVRMRRTIDDAIANEPDPLRRLSRAVRTYLDFFDAHPELAELLIQERAAFKDRPKPTYFVHREANIERWKSMFRALIADGAVRDIPVERITDVLSAVVYGTMFTNFFTRREKTVQQQADDILDVVFRGILRVRPADRSTP